MVARNHNSCIPQGRIAGTPVAAENVDMLGRRIDRYFYGHPEVDRARFLLEALRRELVLRERADRKAQRERDERRDLSGAAEKNIDTSMSVARRLAEINYEKYGFLPRLRRFFMRGPGPE